MLDSFHRPFWQSESGVEEAAECVGIAVGSGEEAGELSVRGVLVARAVVEERQRDIVRAVHQQDSLAQANEREREEEKQTFDAHCSGAP